MVYFFKNKASSFVVINFDFTTEDVGSSFGSAKSETVLPITAIVNVTGFLETMSQR